MTAREAIEAGKAMAPGERLRRYHAVCVPRGGCQREPCERDRGRWSFCPDCMTVYDDYLKPVIPIPDLGKVH